MTISSVTIQSLIASQGYLDPTSTQDSSSTSSSSLVSALSNTTSSSSSSSSGSASSDISQVAYILSSLAKQQKQDPAAFKKNAAATAQDFHDAASECTDTLQRLSLESMAGQFSNAALTGSMASINLASTSNTLTKAYSGSSSLSLLDCLNSDSTGDFSSQVTSILNANVQLMMSSASAKS